MMWRLVLLAPLLFAASTAQAGVYEDDLSKCMISKSTDEDKAGLIRWTYGLMSFSPIVKDLTAITKAQHKKLDLVVAGSFERLLFSACRSEAIAALKYEGKGTWANSFGTLAEAAFQSLKNDPVVNAVPEPFSANISKEKVEALAKEAGFSVRLRAAGSK